MMVASEVGPSGFTGKFKVQLQVEVELQVQVEVASEAPASLRQWLHWQPASDSECTVT